MAVVRDHGKRHAGALKIGAASIIALGIAAGAYNYTNIHFRNAIRDHRIARCMNERSGTKVADGSLVGMLRGSNPDDLTGPYFDLYKLMTACEK